MDQEPYPIEGDILWIEGSSQWLERYEYIEARAEQFLDHYRDNPLYDFTKAGNGVTYQQKSVILAYEKYAQGLLSVGGVKDQVKMLLNAFERKVATPVTPEERQAAIDAAKPVPQWRTAWEEKKAAAIEQARIDMLASQPSKDRDRYILSRMYEGHADISPIPGSFCFSMDYEQGFDPEGKPIDGLTAYAQVTWDWYEQESPVGSKRPAVFSLEADPENIPVQQKTLDQLKQEAKDVEDEKNKERMRSRIK